jgi:molybdopterin-guanine dinucleotide biosynthesis protein A
VFIVERGLLGRPGQYNLLKSLAEGMRRRTMLRVGGVVLCGGRSSRMGQPKAWLPFAGEVMLARVVRLLGEVVSPLVVVAAPEQEVPPLPPAVEVVRDDIEGQGPLQGLVAGLSALLGRAEAAYLSSCDVPFLQPAFVRRMIALLGEHSICVPDVAGYRHPLAAVYRVEVAEVATRLLAAERRRPVFLFDEVPTRIVGATELSDVDPEFRTLRNLNTPAEYELALREVEERSA